MSVERVGPFRIIYREHTGPYQGLRFIMNDVYRYVHDSLQITVDTGITVFYDTSGTKVDDSLRSVSGIVTGIDTTVGLPYRNAVIPEIEAIVGRCYLRSVFSYTTGSLKFYEQLLEFTRKQGMKRNGPTIELYDMSHKSILYIAPCNRGAVPVPAFSGE